MSCNMQCCSPEGTKGEQHTYYMTEYLTMDLFYHYDMHNMYTCNLYRNIYHGLHIGVFVTKSRAGVQQ